VGLLLSLLTAARKCYLAGTWPRDWPAPPSNLELYGIDLREDRVQTARRALGDGAQMDAHNLLAFDFPPSSVIVMLDVLMYVDRRRQGRALEKAAAALEPGGLLLLRETDADGGPAFEVSRLSECLAAALRGEFPRRLDYRGMLEWTAELASLGFTVHTAPMSG